MEPPVKGVSPQDLPCPGRLHVIAYRAMLDVPRELIRYVGRLLCGERRRRGTSNGSRRLTCFNQALFALAWFRIKPGLRSRLLDGPYLDGYGPRAGYLRNELRSLRRGPWSRSGSSRRSVAWSPQTGCQKSGPCHREPGRSRHRASVRRRAPTLSKAPVAQLAASRPGCPWSG